AEQLLPEKIVQYVIAPPVEEESFWPRTRFYGNVEYLQWWIKDSDLPPLVTSGSLNDDEPAALGQPHTSTLFGGVTDNETRSGGRFTFGYWLNDCQTTAVEGSYFLLEHRSVGFFHGLEGPAGSLV